MLCSTESKRVVLDLSCPVHIQTALHSGTGDIINLSQSGMYVSTVMRILPHAYVSIDLPFPERRKFLRIDAVAVWENRGQPHIPDGYGFRFTKVSKDATWGIRMLMDYRGQKIPDREFARNHMEQAERLLEMMLPSFGWHKTG